MESNLRKMEHFPTLYHDVRTAKLQLEYLLEIARAALQPWPKRDSHGRVVHVQNKQLDTEDASRSHDHASGSHALLVDDNDEMSVKLLDEILTKAQTARDVSKKHKKVNTVKTLAPYMESSRTVVQRKVSKPVAKMGGAKSVKQPAEVTDQFIIEKHGNKMTLPSKWSRLRTAVDNLADDKMEPMSKMEGEHFVQLLQQQGGSDRDVNNLLTVRAVIDAVMNDVMLIPKEQWTINSRNSWQALYRVKHHVDLIEQSMVVLRKQIDDTSRNSLPLMHSVTQSSPCRLTYSFYKELLDYIESYTTLQLQLFQLRVSQLCQQYFVPTVCDASMTTSDTVMNIRNMYSLVGVKHSPVFLRMTGNS